MSLIVLSNSQEEYSSKDAEGFLQNPITGIQNPASFTNHLVNPMKIAQDSEVAVQSVKIHRDSTFKILSTDVFYFWLGSALRTNEDVLSLAVDDTGSVPTPINLRQGTYNLREMGDEFQRALRVGISHPYYWDTALVVAKFDTTGNWTGFQLTTDVVTKNGGTNYAIQMSSWNVGDPIEGLLDDYAITTNGTTKRLVRTGATAQDTMANSLIVNTDCPINLMNGFMQFGGLFNSSTTNVDKSWSMSLSRPASDSTTVRGDNGDRPGIFGVASEVPAFQDYTVSWAQRNTDGKRALILSARVFDGVGAGSSMKEIQYWLAVPGGDNGGTNPVTAQITEDDVRVLPHTTGTDGYYGDFKWQTVGEGMRIYMRYWVAIGDVDSWKLIHDSTLAANRLVAKACFPPINQNKWALYVGVSLPVDHTYNMYIQQWNDELR